MKAILVLLAPAALLVSCAPNQTQNNIPVAPAANVGGGTYTPSTAGTPQYQPIDPINPPAFPTPSAPTVTPTAPTYTPPVTTSSPSTLNGNVHTIAKGDSLWGLSRKYGTSVDAIKELNGLSSDTIITGNTIIIPGR